MVCLCYLVFEPATSELGYYSLVVLGTGTGTCTRMQSTDTCTGT